MQIDVKKIGNSRNYGSSTRHSSNKVSVRRTSPRETSPRSRSRTYSLCERTNPTISSYKITKARFDSYSVSIDLLDEAGFKKLLDRFPVVKAAITHTGYHDKIVAHFTIAKKDVLLQERMTRLLKNGSATFKGNKLSEFDVSVEYSKGIRSLQNIILDPMIDQAIAENQEIQIKKVELKEAALERIRARHKKMDLIQIDCLQVMIRFLNPVDLMYIAVSKQLFKNFICFRFSFINERSETLYFKYLMAESFVSTCKDLILIHKEGEKAGYSIFCFHTILPKILTILFSDKCVLTE